ncbi:MAG TPA: glycoside hydrolase family 15 protein [Pseudolabrys sp.]|nr:glycoside hydrolase family 15 protein [Pseudolabrys sp.]
MMRADLDEWIAAQEKRSIAAMERAISATSLTRRREKFGQVIVPATGSVLASPQIANWDPEPDYFFHWLRDSAIVMRSVAELAVVGAGTERARWRRHFEDFVGFSLRLGELNGAGALDHRPMTQREFRRFLRPQSEIAALSGDRLLAEPRFNPDGTVDIFRWSRPQYDGPALRALACLRYVAAGGAPSEEVARLLRRDLSFTLRHAGEPCIGTWEEAGQIAQHYYVALVQLGALVHGRAWAGDAKADWDAAERKLRAALDRHWSDKQGIYLARLPAAEDAGDTLDAAVLLAVWDADLPDGPHSLADPRVQWTQTTIEEFFAREFPINRRRAAPLLGRYRGDHYFGGGAWYPTTLAAAGLYYRRARLAGEDRDAHIARGDAMMDALRSVTPADGALSEQVDRATGEQTSARHLTWSYAAFIAAARARSQAGRD